MMKFDLWMMLKYYILGHLKIESSYTNLKPSPLCEYICEWKKSIISPTKTRKKERKKERKRMEIKIERAGKD